MATEIPNSQGHERLGVNDRNILVEQWRNAPYSVKEYPSGKVTDSNEGKALYEYKAGGRLMMLGQEVMDSCQTPWTMATADRAFNALDLNNSTSNYPETKCNVKVLERGWGMGMIASRIMEHLKIRNGNYTCIELNEDIARHADTVWRQIQRDVEINRATSVMGGEPEDALHIPITIIRGDSFEETARLAEEERKFDIIVSDTYPLSEDEKSINDLLDLDQLIKCLAPDGVFAFFGFHTGLDGNMNDRQRNIVERHFDDVHTTWVHVSPPPDYRYFNPPSGPVRRLPVIICTKPIL